MDDLTALAQDLEDAFFVNGNSRLAESLHELKVLELTSGMLAEVSGLADDDLVQRLAELGVTPSSASALALIPPLAAAWADGSVGTAEHQAIADGLRHTLFFQSIDSDIVDAWLSQPPPPALLDAWEAFARALSAALNDRQRTAMKDGLLALARTVAQASGKVLGMGGVSPVETSVLKRLEGALS
jgi:hypothetical protein